MNPLHQIDAYKISHVFQYPEGTQEIYSNLTARSGKHSNVPTDGVIFIGLKYFIIDYLINEWNDNFFSKPKELVVDTYRKRVSGILGYDVDTSHIASLHDLGYLPLQIKALPEGVPVPYGVPMLTVKNTLSEFYWLTNMIECVLSNELWQLITSATTYVAYLKLFHHYALKTGVDLDFIHYQGHDFSFRGMAGRHAGAASGMAVLLAGCKGTDNVAAIDYVEKYYNGYGGDSVAAFSCAATEHSVVCAGGETSELETLKRIITEVHPSGMVSYVSDSWDFWRLVGDYLPALKSEIMSRDGKVVFRPDSGNPVDILCGYESLIGTVSCEQKGLIESLWDIFGGTINAAGYKVLDGHVGAIYGDSITYERADEILKRLKQKGFASSNVVLGIGSYTYQMCTRDTHGMAVKSTHAIINGKGVDIFKNPKTDDGTKKSAKGYLMVTCTDGVYGVVDQVTPTQERHGCLDTVFLDGALLNIDTYQDIFDRSTSLLLK